MQICIGTYADFIVIIIIILNTVTIRIDGKISKRYFNRNTIYKNYNKTKKTKQK